MLSMNARVGPPAEGVTCNVSSLLIGSDKDSSQFTLLETKKILSIPSRLDISLKTPLPYSSNFLNNVVRLVYFYSLIRLKIFFCNNASQVF